MAAPKRYRDPLQQLAALLPEARRRGESFDEAWKRIVRPDRRPILVNEPDPGGVIMWPTDRPDRSTWQAAIIESRDAWERHYNRLPMTRGDRAVAQLAPVIARLGEFGERTAVG